MRSERTECEIAGEWEAGRGGGGVKERSEIE